MYDTPAWKKFFGDPKFPNDRVGLLFCVDAIPAFAAGTLSLKPAEFINLSLPPGVRTRSENILFMMLLPNNLAKGIAQKKYYDFVAELELNDMATKGWFAIFADERHKSQSVSAAPFHIIISLANRNRRHQVQGVHH